MASIIDFIAEEDYTRYQELLEKAAENKKNAPKKPRAPRGPLSTDAKIKLEEGRKAKAEAKLAAMMAEKQNATPVAEPVEG